MPIENILLHIFYLVNKCEQGAIALVRDQAKGNEAIIHVIPNLSNPL